MANTPGYVALATYEERVNLHETLHQFLGYHTPANLVANEGVMDYTIAATGDSTLNALTPRQILAIQERYEYPGKGS